MDELQAAQIASEEPVLKSQGFNVKKVAKITGISVASLIIAAGLSFSVAENIMLKKNLTNLQGKVDIQASMITGVSNKVTENASSANSLISTLNANAEDMRNREIIIRTEHIFDGGVVTDELVLNKITFTPSLLPKVDAIIDVDTQPSTTLKYQGKGKFDMADRELKDMVVALLEQLKREYNETIDATKLKSNKWETGEFTVTIKNYEIGKYKDGVFTVTKASTLN
jgi:paraquat-inducible protein B